ncbi:unnamed protein product [Ranitomeya imitator]|uniref:Cell cycle progression protein 1 n=1 Tax=Ranitomeya imitator TaxID=111125 RepID=A0ABN9L4R8_9NEOB|nr:unnamed protein product [Ranitomeya imitator]
MRPPFWKMAAPREKTDGPREEGTDVFEQLTEDLEEREDMVLSLEDVMDKITKENHILKQKENDLKRVRTNHVTAPSDLSITAEDAEDGAAPERGQVNIVQFSPPHYTHLLPAQSLVLRALTASSSVERSHGTAHYSNEYAAPPLWEWSHVHMHYCNDRYHVNAQRWKKLSAPGDHKRCRDRARSQVNYIGGLSTAFQNAVDKPLMLETNDLATSLKTEVQNKNLALENQHLRESLEKEEQALYSLKKELRKLREQIRNLDEKGKNEIILVENQKLKEHLKEERQKIRDFRTQKENLLTEAQLLKKELDNERTITDSLRVELEEISKRSTASFKNDHEIENLKDRLSELERKLNFEQQRSDLWERLYIETKEQNDKLEAGKSKGKTKAKDTFFTSVKDTFDAMKNSTKDFVRHHKEKIKQAKEAVKENLKKFSDSVKNTFRHFKDTTRGMFDKNRNRKHGERRREETKGARTVRREYKPDTERMYPKKATASHHEYEDPQDQSQKQFEGTASWKSNDETIKHYPNKKGCSGVYDCAHQESISLFNKVLDPVRVEEFNDLMQVYLQEQVDNFQHWEELEQFINRFFLNGVFIHDQMLFTDFVRNVEDYLEDIKEYQSSTGAVFEDLDEFVYRHYFGNTYSAPHGPRKPGKVPPYKNTESKNRKEEEKQQSRDKQEGKWSKHGRANGRQMANFEIELGQLPFDPKY